MSSSGHTFISRSLPFLVVGGGLFISTFFLPHAYGEPNDPVTEATTSPTTDTTSTAEVTTRDTTTATDTTPITTTGTSNAFIETPIFKENDEPQVLLHPLFNDNSTNIAFYMKCPNLACPDNGTPANPEYVFSAENLGHGALPFSDYWAPPALSDFTAIEYKNDSQQFTCSDKTLEVCKADSHFVALTNFTIVSSSTVITPEMIAAKTMSNTVPTTEATSSTASAALTALSVNLSAASISSNLEDGTKVTATLDGTSTPTTTELAEQASSSSPLASVGSFLSGVVHTIIDAILPGDQSGSTSTDTPAVTPSETVPTSTSSTDTTTVTTTPTSTAPAPSDTTPTPAPADTTSAPTPTPTDTVTPTVTTPTPDTPTSNEPVTSQF